MYVSRRAVLGAGVAGAALLATGCQQKGPELAAVLDTIATNILRESPEFASSLAVSEERAGGRYIDRLSDASREGIQRYRGVLQAGIAELNTIPRASLSGADAVSYDVVKTSLQNDADALAFDFGFGATVPYVVTQINGAYYNVPDFLASRHALTNREEADAYLARLAAYTGVLDQETARIGEDAAKGVIPPDFSIDKASNSLRGFAATAPAQTVLVKTLVDKMAGIEAISAADKTALAQRAEAIVRDEVLPAYQRQVAALAAIRNQATHDGGCWKLPNGEELYSVALRAYTTTSMGADEIHNMGVELVNSLNSEMDAILRAQGMSRGTVAERVQALSARPDQLYPNTDAGREQLLADLNAQVRAITARMPEFCGVQAKAALQIVRVPEYIQEGAPGGYYNGAALDGSRPGMYYINLRNTAEWPRFTLPTLTYHEGVPGHHWQIAIQQEAEGLPFIRSAILGFSAYAEGWGLYAEKLADEAGAYTDNPLGRLGYLQSAAFRASRLVVDTGLHSKRWSREQAIQSMMAATGDGQSNVETEIERYCAWPGQACSYMVGRQFIGRLRDEAQGSMGERWDIKGFHDVVLTNGSVPLSVLETLVDEWSTQAGTS